MDMDTVDRIYSGKEGLSVGTTVQRLICEEKGQGLAEYAIIVATVALLVVGAVAALGLAVQDLLDVPFPANE
jgi:Flp pilus assembly pilin Flp